MAKGDGESDDQGCGGLVVSLVRVNDPEDYDDQYETQEPLHC